MLWMTHHQVVGCSNLVWRNLKQTFRSLGQLIANNEKFDALEPLFSDHDEKV